MTLSSSTAAYEKGFSCMNLQKINIHPSLINQSLDNITRIPIDGPPAGEFRSQDHINS